jgi:putative phosphoesterase
MPGLEALWERIREKRLSYFNEFVELWSSASNERRFERLVEICVEAIYDELRRSTHRPVKVALISDIHANVSALDAVIADARSRGAGMFVCCGDAIWNGAHPEEAMRRLAEIDAFCVAGNNEHRIVAELRDGREEEGRGDMKRQSNGFELERLSAESLRCINSLPFMLILEMDKKRIAVFHGSPDSIDEHLRPGTPRYRYERIIKGLRCDYAVFGHSHHQFKKKVGDALFVNPGSVGWPYDERQGAAYAILTPATGELQFRRPTYDMAPEIRGMLRSGFDEEVVHGLIHARSPKHEGTHYDIVKDVQFMRKRIEEFATRENMDLGHAVYVKDLCLRLFDLLAQTHHMGPRERAYLEFAAMLHDVGFSRGIKAHHKSSFWMILQEKTLPLDLRDRLIVAAVARYHRKRHPKKGDDGYRQLSAQDRNMVEKLSAIIRVADSLDASHGSLMTIRSLRTRHGAVTLDCDAHGSADYELAAFNEKKGLFIEAFHKDIMVNVRPVQE